MSEAPKKLWDPIPPAKVYVSIRLLPEEDDYEFEFAIEPSGNKKEYVRADIAEAEKKAAVREVLKIVRAMVSMAPYWSDIPVALEKMIAQYNEATQ